MGFKSSMAVFRIVFTSSCRGWCFVCHRPSFSPHRRVRAALAAHGRRNEGKGKRREVI
jgi:hypothetical protein